MATRKTATKAVPVKRRGCPPGSGKKVAPAAVEPEVNMEPEKEEEVFSQVKFETIHILDMTNLPIPQKAVLYGFLRDSGYIWKDNLRPPLEQSSDLEFESLVFNHKNKIIHPGTPRDIQSSPAVSRVAVELSATFEFEDPTSVLPNTIQVNNAVYQRIL